MKVDGYRQLLQKKLIYLKGALQMRVNVIEDIGNIGQVDVIRKLTAALHKTAIVRLTTAIVRWDSLSIEQQLSYFRNAQQYIDRMFNTEIKAIKTLNRIPPQSKEHSALIQRGISTHETFLKHTQGMQSVLSWTALRVPKEIQHMMQASVSESLLNYEANEVRGDLISKLSTPKLRAKI